MRESLSSIMGKILMPDEEGAGYRLHLKTCWEQALKVYQSQGRRAENGTEYISEEAIELREVYENEYPTASGDFDEYASHDVPNV